MRDRQPDPAAAALWDALTGLCPPGPPPCAAIARKTGIADATVSDWFRHRYVPPWERFVLLLGYFPAREHDRLTRLWKAARRTRTKRPGPKPDPEPAAPPARIAQLPHDIVDFTGRDREIRTLLDLLEPTGGGLPIVVVEGMAGSGKTRLAVHVLRQAGARLGDVQLYVDLGGFSPGRTPVDAATALAGLLRHLGVSDAELPPDVAGRAALYRDRLEGRRAAVLLDNAASAEQIRPLLPGSSTCRVLVTSRRSLEGLEGSRPLQLGTFDTADALALVTHVVGAERVDAEPAAAARIVELTGRLPLAVSLAARRLRSRPSWRIADLAELLEAEEGRLGRLAASDVAVRAAFAVSYEHLGQPHRRLFRRLAALPGRDFGVHAAAAVGGVPVEVAAETLETLLDEHLLEGAGPGRYSRHDLLALFAREQLAAEESTVDRREAVRRGLQWCLRTADLARHVAKPNQRDLVLAPLEQPPTPPDLPSPEACQAWYDVERANLAAAISLAAESGEDEIAWKLAISLFCFCHARQSWREFEVSLRTAHLAARRLGDMSGDAWVLNFLGIAAAELGRFDDARRHLEEAVAINRAAGDPDGEGQALNNLGEVLRRTGDAAGAIALYRQDLELSRSRDDTLATAICLDNIGRAELDRGDLRTATAVLAEALAVARTAGDPNTEAEIHRHLGDTAAATGDLDDAAASYRRSAELYERLGDPAGALESLTRHAETAADRDPAAVAGLVRDADRLLPRLDEPFAGQLRARLDKVAAV